MSVRTQARSDAVEIAVDDTGVGIAPEDQGPIVSAEALANELLMTWCRDDDDAAVVVASRRE